MLGLTASAVSAMREGVRVASPKRLSLDTMSSEASRRVSSELSLVGAKRTVMVNSSVPSAVDSRMGESLEGSCAGESMEKPCVSPRVDSDGQTLNLQGGAAGVADLQLQGRRLVVQAVREVEGAVRKRAALLARAGSRSRLASWGAVSMLGKAGRFLPGANQRDLLARGTFGGIVDDQLGLPCASGAKLIGTSTLAKASRRGGAVPAELRTVGPRQRQVQGRTYGTWVSILTFCTSGNTSSTVPPPSSVVGHASNCTAGGKGEEVGLFDLGRSSCSAPQQPPASAGGMREAG